MNKTIKTVLQFVLFLGLGIFLIIWIYKGLTPEQIQNAKAAFLNADLRFIGMIFIVGVFSHFFRAMRWRIMMKPMGYSPGILNTFSAVIIGYLANLAFPRLGEITKCGVLNRYEQIPVDKLVGTIIIERIFDMLCLLLIMAYTIISQLTLLQHFFNENIANPLYSKWSSLSANKLLFIMALVCCILVAVVLVIKKMQASGKFEKINNFIKGIFEGMRSILKMKNKGLFLIYSIAIWLCYLGMQKLAFYTMQQTASLSLGAALSCISFGSLGVIATQGGIGAYHKIVMETLKLYNIAGEYGFAYAWISWGTQTLVMVVGGFAALIYLPLINKKKNAI